MVHIINSVPCQVCPQQNKLRETFSLEHHKQQTYHQVAYGG